MPLSHLSLLKGIGHIINSCFTWSKPVWVSISCWTQKENKLKNVLFPTLLRISCFVFNREKKNHKRMRKMHNYRKRNSNSMSKQWQNVDFWLNYYREEKQNVVCQWNTLSGFQIDKNYSVINLPLTITFLTM